MQIFYHLLCSFVKIALITGVTVHQKKTIVHRNLHGLYIHNWLSGKGMIYVATFQAGKLSPPLNEVEKPQSRMQTVMDQNSSASAPKPITCQTRSPGL